jgi:phage baseplate assembly protein W
MASGIAPALPLTYDQADGPYLLTKGVAQTLSQNLKNLILTNPGERVMDPEFGVGILTYLFDLNTGFLESEISEKIYEQVDKYLPPIEIKELNFSYGSNDPVEKISIEKTYALYLEIKFKILPLSTEDVLILPLPTRGGE